MYVSNKISYSMVEIRKFIKSKYFTPRELKVCWPLDLICRNKKNFFYLTSNIIIFQSMQWNGLKFLPHISIIFYYTFRRLKFKKMFFLLISINVLKSVSFCQFLLKATPLVNVNVQWLSLQFLYLSIKFMHLLMKI